MKRLRLLLLLAALHAQTNAQIIDTAVLKTYSSSVIGKVHDVATRVSLTSAEQVLLANLFLNQEQQLAGLILSGASVRVTDSVSGRQVNEFNSLLSSSKLESYYKAKVADKAATIARLTSKMLQSKYSVENIMRQYFGTMYEWREALLEKIWLSNTDTASRNADLYNAIFTYDTLISKYELAAESGLYYKIREHYIDSFQTIPASKKDALASGYFNKCMQNRHRSLADNFDDAFNTAFNEVADTSYYAIVYGSQVNAAAKIASQSAVSMYIKVHPLSAYTVNAIIPYITQRERAIALIDKVHREYSIIKNKAIDDALAIYQPIIDSIIALDGSMYNTSQIDIAIKFSTELGLSQSQLTRLHEASEQLNKYIKQYKAKDPTGEYDSKVFESQVLNNILSEDQYTQVLAAKFSGKAESMAKTDWDQILIHGLQNDYDLVEQSTKTELTNYHLALLIAYYRNANNLKEQYLSVKRIQEVMPVPMKLLLEKWEYKTPYGDAPDVFFQW